MEKAAVWPDLFRASHTIGPDFLLPLGLFNKNEWVMRHCVMPLADDMLRIWKIRNYWLLKKWNWEKKMKLLWKVLLSVCPSIFLWRIWPSSFSSSVHAMSPEGKAGLFLSVLRKAMPLWFHSISSLVLAQRGEVSLVRREDKRSNPAPSPKRWDEDPITRFASFAWFCNRSTPVSRAGIQPLCLWQQQQEKEAPGELEIELKAEYYMC